jgi:hypothetical protein
MMCNEYQQSSESFPVGETPTYILVFCNTNKIHTDFELLYFETNSSFNFEFQYQLFDFIFLLYFLVVP